MAVILSAFAWAAGACSGGGFYLREFISNADMKCEVTAPAYRRRVLERLKALAHFLEGVAQIRQDMEIKVAKLRNCMPAPARPMASRTA